MEIGTLIRKLKQFDSNIDIGFVGIANNTLWSIDPAFTILTDDDQQLPTILLSPTKAYRMKNSQLQALLGEHDDNSILGALTDRNNRRMFTYLNADYPELAEVAKTKRSDPNNENDWTHAIILGVVSDD